MVLEVSVKQNDPCPTIRNQFEDVIMNALSEWWDLKPHFIVFF